MRNNIQQSVPERLASSTERKQRLSPARIAHSPTARAVHVITLAATIPSCSPSVRHLCILTVAGIDLPLNAREPILP